LLLAAVAAAQTVDLSDPTARRMANGTLAGAGAGTCLEAGDVSGDIFNKDMFVCSPDAGGGRGEVRVLFGWLRHAGTFPLTAADIVLTGGAAGDRFGTSANAGFLTTRQTRPESTARDLVVGAPGAAGGRGEIYVFAGPLRTGQSLTPADAIFRVIGAAGDQLGVAVETADLNGDGFREIIAGAPGQGRVYVIDYHNASTTTRDLATQGANITITGAGIGGVLAAGDIAGDSKFDLVIGAPSVANGAGAVYVITTPVSGVLPAALSVPANATATLNGTDAGDHAGAALWIKEDGDFDGDNRWDLLIGAPDADGPGNNRPGAGEVYVIFGAAGLPAVLSPGSTLYGAGANHRLGSRARSGDITRDVPDDLAMLAPGANGGFGEGYVYYGRSRSQFPAFVDLGSSANRRFLGDETQGALATMIVWEATGEGAEDVVFGVPAANTGAGRLYFSLSPTLSTGASSTLAARVGRDLSVDLILNVGQSWTVPVWLENGTAIPVTWNVSSNRPWLHGSPANGMSVIGQNGTFQVVASAAGLAPGTYTGTLRAASTADDLAMAVSVTVRITVVSLPRQPADFSGDGRLDLLWQHNTTGDVSMWRMNGTVMVSGTLLNPDRVTDTNWKIAGTGDFNGDGHPDVLWHHQSEGWLSVWLMNGANQVGGISLTPDRVADANWKVVATADFNGDGKRDLVWHHATTGQVSVWFMDGARMTSGTLITPEGVADTNWKVVGAGDFNGDRKPDLIWHNQATGQLSAWLMNGTRLIDGVWMSPNQVADTNWKIRAVGDVNRDGHLDLIWQHVTSGQISAWLMNGIGMASGTLLTPGSVPDLNWRIAGPR
jgi:hypothetical protein